MSLKPRLKHSKNLDTHVKRQYQNSVVRTLIGRDSLIDALSMFVW